MRRSPLADGQRERQIDTASRSTLPGNILLSPGVERVEKGEGAILWKSSAADPGEFEQVALVHLDALYQTALRLTHNRAEAEDVVQDTYVRAFRSFHRFNAGTNCRAWLFTIMRNVFLNRVRGAGREVLDPEMTMLDTDAESATVARTPRDDPEEHFLHTVLHGDVDRALRALPFAYREVVVLADLQGLSYREIAAVGDCPIGTVMSRLSRGRDLLRHALGRLAQEHGYVERSE